MTMRSVILLVLCGAVACSDSGNGAGGDDSSGGSGSGAGSGAGNAGHGSPAGGSGGSGGSGSGSTAGSGSDDAGSGGSAAGSGSAGMDEAGSGGGAAGTSGSAGGGGEGGGEAGSGGSGEPPPAAPMSFEDTQQAIEDYAAAHPGMDGDILAKTPDQLAADPDAQALHSLCGEGALPVIPQLVWEYGGGDHAWINPEASALVYCVYIPTADDSEHWSYDAAMDHVTADVFVLFPEDNPCADQTGAAQVEMCIGDPSNFEILVDTASMNDGHDAGLELSEASTDLNLILPDGSEVHLFFGA